MIRGPVAAPPDTLVIVGGRSISRVDADGAMLAATRLDDAASSLRTAAFRCAAAASELERSMWAPDAFRDAGFAVCRQAAALASDAAQRLSERATACALLGERLRRAAGLYRHSEGLAERVVGGLAAGGSGGLGIGAMLSARDPRSGVPVFAGLALGLALGLRLARWTGADFEWVSRAAAPFTDEAVGGLGFGVAAATPLQSGLDASVTGGARTLSRLVHGLLPQTVVAVTPARGTTPGWTGSPSGSVAEALARTADLYPWGSGIPGRRVPGVPRATVAVERVEHTDGTTSWTVLMPGTQSPIPSDHPLDAVTDLDLMAHRAADVTVAVERALAEAGALPDEPVVLVGHSLGGIAAMALASSDAFHRRHRLGGVVTAGAPTATFAAPRGVPVIHLENDEELVSQLDGRSSAENPATRDRVTVGRALRLSSDATDQVASGSVARAHGMSTHLRTLELAREAGSAPVADVVGRIEALLDGEHAETRLFTARRRLAEGEPLVLAPGERAVSPSSGRTVR